MALPVIAIDSTLLVTSVAAASNAVVSDSQTYWIHRFYVTISAAATVSIQASADGGTTWFDLVALVTASGLVIIDRPFKALRASWAGNTGTVTVRLEQLASNPVGMI